MTITKVIDLKKGDIIIAQWEENTYFYTGRGFSNILKQNEVFGKVKGMGDKNGDPMRIRFYNFVTKETTRLQLYKNTTVKVLDTDEADLMMLNK